MKDKPYADTWIENLRLVTRCEWCGVGTRRLTRRGLCRHCNEIRKKLDKLQKMTKTPPSTIGPSYHFQMELAIMEAEKANCIVYGNVVKRILNGGVDGLSLEHQLSRYQSAYRAKTYSMAMQHHSDGHL
jgi:hypothetical protein